MTLIWIGFSVAFLAETISLTLDFYVVGLKNILPKINEVRLKIIFHLLALLGIFISLYGGMDTYSSLTAVQNYSLDARLNRCGLPGIVSAGLTESTPLSQALGIFLVCNTDHWSINSCESSTTQEIQRITRAFPNSPWPVFYMAVCLQKNNDPDWVNYAKKSIGILQLTTKLEDHHKEQDIALEALQQEISNPFPQNPSIMQQYINDIQEYNAAYNQSR